MEKVFELEINGKFIQYLMPSEVKLLKHESGKIFTLTPVEVTKEAYNQIFGMGLNFK